MAESRVRKTLLNMRVNMVTYLVAIVVAFFTRKVLLDQLGAEFMGLTTTVNSLLGFLNLAELGVGASIAYFLYKPFFDDDRSKICETISIMGYLYRRIGTFIFLAGVAFSVFLPWMFSDTPFSWAVIYYCFYAQLVSALLGYFINYKANTIFAADQRQYLVNGFFQATQFVAVILQAVVAYYTRSFVAYITISLLLSVVNCLLLNWKFRQVYPWIETSIARGKEALQVRPEIMRYVRRVFIHQLGAFVNQSALPLVIYGYASLSVVTLYANYAMLKSKVGNFFYALLSGTEASVGNLIAEGDSRKTYSCYCELFSVKAFVIIFLSCCLVRFASPFIAVWLGPEYVLEPLLVWLLCLDFCLNMLRNTTDQFINGYGLKADVWVPVCRVLSLGVMVLTGQLWGLTGILFVPVVFQLLFTHIWKPIYLYRSGFHLPLIRYVRLFAVNLLPFVVAYLATDWLLFLMGLDLLQPDGWWALVRQLLIFGSSFLALSFALSWPINEGLRLFVRRVGLKIIDN